MRVLLRTRIYALWDRARRAAANGCIRFRVRSAVPKTKAPPRQPRDGAPEIWSARPGSNRRPSAWECDAGRETALVFASETEIGLFRSSQSKSGEPKSANWGRGRDSTGAQRQAGCTSDQYLSSCAAVAWASARRNRAMGSACLAAGRLSRNGYPYCCGVVAIR